MCSLGAPGRRHRPIVVRALRLAGLVYAGLVSWGGPAHAEGRARLTPSVRSLSIPAGAFSLEQRAIGAGIAIEPAPWLVLETGFERATTELAARDLDVDPLEVETRLGVERRWGFVHAVQ